MPPDCSTISVTSFGMIGTHERYNDYCGSNSPEPNMPEIEMPPPLKRLKTADLPMNDAQWISYDIFKEKFDKSFPCLKIKKLDESYFTIESSIFKGVNIKVFTLNVDMIKCCEIHTKSQFPSFYYEVKDKSLITSSEMLHRSNKYKLSKRNEFIPLPANSFNKLNYYGHPPFLFSMLCMPSKFSNVEIFTVDILDKSWHDAVSFS